MLSQTSGAWKVRKQVIAAAAAVALATAVHGDAASAAGGGGGGAEPVPMTNFTDLPSYHPKPVGCLRWDRRVGKHVRWHPTSRYYN
jgi:hypothetical protein